MHPQFTPANSTTKPAVAIQGDRASFHDVAANQFFGTNSDRIFCGTFDAAFQSLANKQADYALCAIENSLYGSINEVYDLLMRHHCFIFGEVYLRIEQCLIGLPGASVESIKTIYSHPVALAQCTDYLDHTLPQAKRQEHHDTAGSVQFVKEQNNPAIVAIASREAAELYGMKVLAESIESNKENYTRFVCLANTSEAAPHNANKTSLLITTGDTPGSLYHALGSFAQRTIGISKIQSRPIIGKAWTYMFYIDALAGIQDEALQAALHELTEQQGRTVKVLGSYRNGLES